MQRGSWAACLRPSSQFKAKAEFELGDVHSYSLTDLPLYYRNCLQTMQEIGIQAEHDIIGKNLTVLSSFILSIASLFQLLIDFLVSHETDLEEKLVEPATESKDI